MNDPGQAALRSSAGERRSPLKRKKGLAIPCAFRYRQTFLLIPVPAGPAAIAFASPPKELHLPACHGLLYGSLPPDEIVEGGRLLPAALLQPHPHQGRHPHQEEHAVILHFLRGLCAELLRPRSRRGSPVPDRLPGQLQDAVLPAFREIVEVELPVLPDEGKDLGKAVARRGVFIQLAEKGLGQLGKRSP